MNVRIAGCSCVAVAYGALVGLGSVPAWSQEGQQVIVEEIVVTAKKRGEQRLQDLPESITAITGETIRDQGITDFVDYARLVPSLSFVDQSPGQTKLVVRGVSTGFTRLDSVSESETAGLYLNEIPMSVNAINPDLDLYDIERIEVLRGPQGTLYGAGAMSGAVRIITRDPDPNEFEGSVEGYLADTKHGEMSHSAKFALNLPLAEDTAALRIVGYHNYTGGVLDNVVPFTPAFGNYANPSVGLDGDPDADHHETYGGRTHFRWMAVENLTVDATAIWQKTDMGIWGQADVDPNDLVDLGRYDAFRPVDEYSNIRTVIGNLTIRYDFEWGEFKSSTSYLDRDWELFSELTYLVDLFFGHFPGPGSFLGGQHAPVSPIENYSDVKDYIEEATLSGKFMEDRVDWILGFYYSERDRNYLQRFLSPGFDELAMAANPGFPGTAGLGGYPLGQGDNLGSFDTYIELGQVAVFGEVTYRLTDRLSTTVGLRWFDFDYRSDFRNGGFFSGGVVESTLKDSENGVNPKFNLSWNLNDDVLVYANVAKGFRSGSTNQLIVSNSDACDAALAAAGGSAGQPPPVDSDSIWNYELGFKGAFADNRVAFNAAAYFIDWSKVQASQQIDECGFIIRDNGGDAEGRGIEVEVIAQLATGLSVSAGGSYNDVELGDDFPTFGGSDGDNMPYVPKWNLNAMVSYEFPINLWGDATGFFNFSVGHIGTSYTSFDQTSGYKQPSYEVGKLNFGVARGNWRLSAVVDNVWDEKGDVFFQANAFRWPPGTKIRRLQPRTIGLRVQAGF